MSLLFLSPHVNQSVFVSLLSLINRSKSISCLSQYLPGRLPYTIQQAGFLVSLVVQLWPLMFPSSSVASLRECFQALPCSPPPGPALVGRAWPAWREAWRPPSLEPRPPSPRTGVRWQPAGHWPTICVPMAVRPWRARVVPRRARLAPGHWQFPSPFTPPKGFIPEHSATPNPSTVVH